MGQGLRKAGFYPAGIKLGRIPFLVSFLETEGMQTTNGRIKVVILGWGCKRTGRHARLLSRLFAANAGFLEDGFLRSFGTGEKFPPLSLILDDRGIYYDATKPSQLECLLNSDIDVLSGLEGTVSTAKGMMLKYLLSKYNHAPLLARLPASQGKGRKILVVDQTEGDLSIRYAGAKASTFRKMLLAAQAENPDAMIYVKTHPSVASGQKKGHFSSEDGDSRTVLLTDLANPVSIIDQMDHIYVVSSTMGFEALLAGKPVTCFGIPWYAGWGVTDDRQPCLRRTARRTVDELFAAAYFHYARYIDPVTRKKGTIFDVINWIVRQKKINQSMHGTEGRGRLICIGFRRWKQANIAPILALEPDRVMFVADVEAARKLEPSEADRLVWWGVEAPEGISELVKETGATTLRMEDGFIRSVGLGSDLIAPLSLILDSKGLYFDPRQPSDLEDILANTEFGKDDIAYAQKIRRLIIENGVTKYNLEPRRLADWNSRGQNIILVPGQVEDDASIRFGCSGVKTNVGLLEAVRAANPEAFIVYKPHPDVMSGNRNGRIALQEAARWADHIETRLSVISCIEACDEVHVMTSLTGFDALLRGKRVVTYGEPFYAGWGLTEDFARNGLALPRRVRKLSLDELVSGVLVHYPVYWDAELKGYSDCEATIYRIMEIRDRLEAQGRLSNLRSGYFRRLWRKARILTVSWFATN